MRAGPNSLRAVRESILPSTGLAFVLLIVLVGAEGGIASCNGEQLGAKVDRVERRPLPVLGPIIVDNDLNAVWVEQLAQRGEILEVHAGDNGGSRGSDKLSAPHSNSRWRSAVGEPSRCRSMALAKTLAEGIHIVPQALGERVPEGLRRLREIGWLSQLDLRPIGNLCGASIPGLQVSVVGAARPTLAVRCPHNLCRSRFRPLEFPA